MLRYLYSFNDASDSALQTYQALGERFLSNLHQRQQSLKDKPVDDALIDIDVKDIVDMVRVYSAFSKTEERTLFVPQLFSDETTDQPEDPAQTALQLGQS